ASGRRLRYVVFRNRRDRFVVPELREEVLLDEVTQGLRLGFERAALEAVELEKCGEPCVQLRQAEVVDDLLANPLVVGDRVRTARDVQTEEEALERSIEAVERLEVEVAAEQPGDS